MTAAIAAAVFWLAFDGGSYSLLSRTSVAIAVWWAIALTVALRLLPLARPPRAALVSGGLLVAFAGWTAASTAWAASAEKVLNEFNRTTLYVGVFLLAVLLAKQTTARWFTDSAAIGITGVAFLALASRLFP